MLFHVMGSFDFPCSTQTSCHFYTSNYNTFEHGFRLWSCRMSFSYFKEQSIGQSNISSIGRLILWNTLAASAILEIHVAVDPKVGRSVLPLFKIRHPEINFKFLKFQKISWNFKKYPEILQNVQVFYQLYMMLLIPEIFSFSKCAFSILENPSNSWKFQNFGRSGWGR